MPRRHRRLAPESNELRSHFGIPTLAIRMTGSSEGDRTEPVSFDGYEFRPSIAQLRPLVGSEIAPSRRRLINGQRRFSLAITTNIYTAVTAQ